MTSVRFTRTAFRDIEAIEDFSLREFGREQTAAYLLGLTKAVRMLLDYPMLGQSRDDLRRGTRTMKYQSHRVYYEITPDEIIVHRILHQARVVHGDMFE